MSKVKLQLAMSLDGYIARSDGSVDFLDAMHENLTEDFNTFVESIDTIIMGRGTYEVMLGFGEIPFQNKKIIIMTSKDLEVKQENIIISDMKIEDVVEKESGNIWLFGGAKLIQSFVNLDLVDEFHIVVVPKIIGSGIPLFLENKRMEQLKLEKVNQYGDLVMIVYKRKR